MVVVQVTMPEKITRFDMHMAQIMHALHGSTNAPNNEQSWWAEVQQLKALAQSELAAPKAVTPVPPYMRDGDGKMWVFCGMTELGPAYRPQE